MSILAMASNVAKSIRIFRWAWLFDMAEEPVAAPTAPAPRHIFRRWLWSILWILAFFAIATGILVATVQTERGARAAWRIASIASSGHLGGTLTGGTLAHGLHFRNLYYQDEKRKIA